MEELASAGQLYYILSNFPLDRTAEVGRARVAVPRKAIELRDSLNAVGDIE